ncbi:MAG TPA: hypothetical protein VF384_01275 [Planctomycetota bacterium]
MPAHPRTAPCLLLLLAAAATAQDDAPWLLASRVDVAGNTSFSTATIRDEIATSVRIADALLRARHDDEREQLIADGVADGYRLAGFPDVAVSSERKDGRLLLQIVEGPRCRIGAVRVTGNKELATDQLVSALRQPEEPWPGWQGDAWADCSSMALARARQRVVIVYGDSARWGVGADVAFVRAEQRVDLVVGVRDEGRPVAVGPIRLQGERPEDVDAVLRLVQPPEETPLTTTLARSLRTKLEDLGRYRAVASVIDWARPEKTSTSPLISVQVASFAPAIDDTPMADLAQLRAGFATVRKHLDAGNVVRVVVPLPDEWSALGFTWMPGPLVCTIGKDGIGVRSERVRCPDGSTNAVELLFGATRSFVTLGDGACGVLEYDAVSCQVQVSFVTHDDGSFELRWGFGFSTRDAVQAQVATFLHPTSVLRLLQRGNATRDGDDLLVEVPDGKLRVDRAGAVRTNAKEGELATALLPDTLAGLIDAAQRRFDEARVHPLGAYLLRFGTANAAALTAATTPAQRDALACLRATADWWSTRRSAATHAPRGEEFSVPGGKSWPGISSVLAPVLIAAAKLTPEPGWVAQLARPMRALMQQRGDGVKAVNALAAAETSGPFATATAAALLDAAGFAGPAQRCWQRAVERCTADAAIADLRSLVSPEAPPEWLSALAAHLRSAPQTTPIFADLPADAKPADVLARAFARCWDAGLGDRVKAMLQHGG